MDSRRTSSGLVARSAEGTIERLRAHVRELVSEVRDGSPAPVPALQGGPASLPDRIFRILASREFCYLSAGRVASYREEVLGHVRRFVERGEPVRFFYDIGGGYHASLRPGVDGLSFDVGLAELYVLRQIRRFSSCVEAIYGPGVRFHLVIDNLCAKLVNDIPVTHTLGYCERLRELIRETGVSDLVQVLVESEVVAIEELRAACGMRNGHGAARLTPEQHENVERFLGRTCGAEEAVARSERYADVTAASERMLAAHIDGVHMTQRASPSTMCFRPFPGGDSRIQSGEVALRNGAGRALRPILLTSRNLSAHACLREPLTGVLPKVVPHVTYVEHIAG